MPNKPNGTASRRATSHRGVRHTYARPVHVRKGPKAGSECVGTEPSPPSYRIDITRLGKHARFRISSNSDPSVAVTSTNHKTPKEAKAALIKLIQALRADDFDSYDFT